MNPKDMNIKSSMSNLMPQSVEEKKILNARAHHLAQTLSDNSAELESEYYVSFKLGKEYYGLPFKYIKEVLLHASPTKVPHTPAWIAGIINRDGMLISLLDLKPFFHIKTTKEITSSHLIVLQVKNTICALLADSIEGSKTYHSKTLEAPLTADNSIKPKYILGLDQGKTAILNIETLLSDIQLNKSPIKGSIS